MNVEVIFNMFKSEFLQDDFSLSTKELTKYIEDNPQGVRIRDLGRLVTSLTYLTSNIEDLNNFSLSELGRFFDVASLGFIKEKSFDDKLNNTSLIALMNLVALIIEKTGEIFESDVMIECEDKAQLILEIALHALNFIHNFLSDQVRFINLNNPLPSTKQLVRVEYLPTKRFKNLRECERSFASFIKEEELENQPIAAKGKRPNEVQHENDFEVFEASDLPVTFINFLQRHSSSLRELSIIVLEIKRLTSTRPSLCRRVVSLGLLKDLAYIIYDHRMQFRDYLIKLAFEILWNSLEVLEREAVASIESEDILLIFKELFCLILANGYKLEDKVLRNELMVLINALLQSGALVDCVMDCGELRASGPADPVQQLLAMDHKSDSFHRYSLLDIMLYICCSDEIASDNKATERASKRRLLDLSNEDIQFKKLAISSVHLILRHTQSAELLSHIEQGPFVQVMMLYVEAELGKENEQLRRLTQPQIREIQSECLATLETVARCFPARLVGEGALNTIMRLSEKLRGDSRLVSLLAVLNRLAETQTPELKQLFSESGAIDTLLGLLNSNEHLGGLSEDDITRIRALCFNTLARMAENSPANQKLMAQKGAIEVFILYLKNQKIHKSEKNVLLTIGLFNSLWSCVLRNPQNEETFLESEGLFTLLEFIETALRQHLKQALSFVSGLMENRRSFRYFEEWVSSICSVNATQLLLKIFAEEDARFHVEYKDGVLVSQTRPLNPVVERSSKELKIRKGYSRKAFGKLLSALKASPIEDPDRLPPDALRSSSLSVDAVVIKQLKAKSEFFDLRRSVFAILYRIGFDRNKLSQAETQLMASVNAYPQLRVGEIWMDIKENLTRKNAEPTPEDKNFIEQNIEEFRKTLASCVNQQMSVTRERKRQQEEELGHFYNLLRNQKKYIR